MDSHRPPTKIIQELSLSHGQAWQDMLHCRVWSLRGQLGQLAGFKYSLAFIPRWRWVYLVDYCFFSDEVVTLPTRDVWWFFENSKIQETLIYLMLYLWAKDSSRRDTWAKTPNRSGRIGKSLPKMMKSKSVTHDQISKEYFHSETVKGIRMNEDVRLY